MNSYIQQLRELSPIVHCITNYVSMNDCANILLGCGALPIMAGDSKEAAQICQSANALVLNLGTPSTERFNAMRIAAKTANENGIPITLDPVGVGASDWRLKFANELLNTAKISVIRGNLSEIKTLCGIAGNERGVDSAGFAEDSADRLHIAHRLSEMTDTCVVISGKDDIVCRKSRAAVVHNGNAMMSKITGCGCMLSALCAAFSALEGADLFEAILDAVCEFGIAGETAKRRMSELDGNGSMRTYIMDAVCNMTDDILSKGVNYEILQ